MWPKVEEEIKEQNFDYSAELTKEPLHAIDIAKDKGKDFDCIVATGGDGTVNEVANGVYEIDGTFGCLPLGNGNDFAFGHKYNDDYLRSLNILREMKTLDMGVGIARCEDNERYFINIVDTGVGATISVSAFTDAKWLRGFAKYYYLALKGIMKYRLVPARIQIEGYDEIKNNLLIIALGFGNRFGAGFNVLPNNYGFRDDFEIVLVGDVRKLYQIYLLNVLKPGKHIDKKGVYFYNGKKVKLEVDKPLPIEVEGEIVSFGAKSIEFEVAPRRIKTVVPQELIDLKNEKSK
jgi:YegS/Rv2252/BmrU family lipid kinase